MPGIGWSCPDYVNNRQYANFMSFLNRCTLDQYVFEPTRASNILDLVFCSVPDIIYNCRVSMPFSDHNTVIFSIPLLVTAPVSSPNTYHAFREWDYDSIILFLGNIDWNSFFNSCFCIQDAYDIFLDCIFHGVEHYVPVKSCRPACKVRRWPPFIL